MQLSEIKIGKRFRKDNGNIQELADSIKKLGLLHPIVVSEKGELIAGLRRIEAYKKLGWTEIPTTIVNLQEIRDGEIDENSVRKDFTPSEIGAIDEALRPKEQAEAEQRKKQTQFKNGKPPSGGGTVPRPKKGKTRDNIGKVAGKSGKYVEQCVAIVKATKKNPEKFTPLLASVDSGKTSVKYAYQQVKKFENQTNTPPLPEGEFNVIYADPPWQYDLTLRGNPDEHYATMEGQKISDLKIPSAKDAVLFLWATNPKLQEALEVMKAWGFEYKTNLVWVKDKFGNGYYFRGQHELLLLGIKGKIGTPFDSDRPSSVLNAKREEHSKKPREVYGLIEKMYPNRKYLELFARGNNGENWTAWGNQNQA